MLSAASEQEQLAVATRQKWHVAIGALLAAQVVLSIVIWIACGLHLSASKHNFDFFSIIMLLSPILPIVISGFSLLKSNALHEYMWISIGSHTFCFLSMIAVSAIAAVSKQQSYALSIVAGAFLLMSGCSATATICTMGRAYELKSY